MIAEGSRKTQSIVETRPNPTRFAAIPSFNDEGSRDLWAGMEEA